MEKNYKLVSGTLFLTIPLLMLIFPWYLHGAYNMCIGILSWYNMLDTHPHSGDKKAKSLLS